MNLDKLILPAMIVAAFCFAYWTFTRDQSKPLSATFTEVRVSFFGSSSSNAKTKTDSLVHFGPEGTGPGFFENDFDSALQQARAYRKPLLIVFGADYCGACHQFLEVTCPSSVVKGYYDRVVWLHMDTQKHSTQEFCRKHPEISFHYIPYVVYMHWNGRVLNTHNTATPETLAMNLDDAISRTGSPVSAR